MRRMIVRVNFLLIIGFAFISQGSAQSSTRVDLVDEITKVRSSPDLGLFADILRDRAKGNSVDAPASTLQKLITNGPGEASDFFGYDVAIDGDTAVVGAYQERTGPYRMGAAHVFVWNGSSWVHQQKLNPPPNSSGMDFGWSVAISGDTIMIGAPTYNCGASAVLCGAVYFFERNGTIWTERQRLLASDYEDSHQFGYDVAISGDNAVVGEIGNVIVEPGSAYFLLRSGGVWTEIQNVEQGEDTDDDFGWGVAIEGDTAVVGFPRYANYTGGACVYNRAGSLWTRSSCLYPNDPSQGSQFGNTVDISGDSILVGAPSTFSSNKGAGYVFVKEAGAGYQQQVKLTAPDGSPADGLGAGAAIDGDKVVLGAFQHNSSTGAAYTFSRCLSDWGFGEKLTAADGAPGDAFGRRVALSGDKFITSSPFATVNGNTRQGAAYAAVLVSPLLFGEGCDISIIVNRTTDEPDDDIEDDVCDIDENTLEQECTLRAAIETANARAGRDIISFDIPGAGTKTISPATTLPLIDEVATIDATTQPGYSGTPLIQLSGGAPGVNPGLGMLTNSADSRIRGLAIYGFETNVLVQSAGSYIGSNYIGLRADGTDPTPGEVGFGVVVTSGASNTMIGGTDASDGNVIGGLNVGIGIFGGSNSTRILNNKIGTNPAGDAERLNEVGVLTNNSNGTRIGEAGDGNLISGAFFAGVYIYQSSATLIKGNRIGTNAAGTDFLGTVHGIAIQGGSGNKIGDIALADGNLISGTSRFGVVLYDGTANNQIINNSVGTKADGVSSLGNYEAGIAVEGGANNNTIENNVVGGQNEIKTSTGIYLTGSAGANNIVKGNFIGVARDGTTAIPNNIGVEIDSSSQIIGQDGSPNLFCHNLASGLYIRGDVNNPTVTGNVVQHNRFGTNGSLVIGSQMVAIAMFGNASENLIKANIIGGAESGIFVFEGPHDNVISENKIGTNGTSQLQNTVGIDIQYAENNRIEDNLLSGNDIGVLIGGGDELRGRSRERIKAAIRSRGSAGGVPSFATGNSLSGNIIGLNADQTAAIANYTGVWIGEEARNNLVGTATGDRNVIAGNQSDAVFIGTLASNPSESIRPRDNVVQRNFIGVDSTQSNPFPNGVAFTLSQTSGNVIGGATEDLGNIIVASKSEGIRIAGSSEDNTIINNLIGTIEIPELGRILAGRPARVGKAFGNGGHGISIIGKAIKNKIFNNKIGNNGGNGIHIESPEAPQTAEPQTLITGNQIGVTLDQAGTTIVNIANTLSGILIKNTGNVQVGDVGANAGNIIGGNGMHGIMVSGKSQLHARQTNAQGSGQFATRIINNSLGMIKNLSGTPLPAGNQMHGVIGQDVADLIIGGSESGMGNLIMASGGKGLYLKGVHPVSPGAIAAVVKGNSAGAIKTAVNQITTNLGNLLGGMEIEDSSSIEIGASEGEDESAGNLVASNGFFGIKATVARVVTTAKNSVIKNQGPAVHLYRTTESSVIGNGIGIALGDEIADSGNVGPGVLVEESPGNTIGGSEISKFNKIGKHVLNAAIHYRNTHPIDGVPTGGATKGNLLGGRVGTFGGIVNRASNAMGVFVENSSFVTIGGTAETEGNSIVASSSTAIRIKGSTSRAITAIRNIAGKVAQHHGTEGEPMGNGEDGVMIEEGASDNNIGGDGVQPLASKQVIGSSLGNTITGNGRHGILLSPTAGNNNRLGGNNIFGNSGNGIDIGNDGNTANDPLDADSGPNNLQNYPEIMSTQIVGNDLIVNFRLDSAPEHSAYGTNGIFIEFFKADAGNEGERFLGSTFYTLDDYNSLVPGIKTVNLGDLTILGINGTDAITSTATDANGNSSEFTPRFGPTAAGVKVSGRLITLSGNGVRNAIVSLTDSSGNRRSVMSASLGYFEFQDVETGETYVLSVSSKRFTFAPQVFVVTDEIAGIELVGTENSP